jgi:phosphatidylglycerol---prolipoprotein diacylglyceryl transferase
MILLVIAAWIGLSLAEQRAERHGIAKDQLNNLTFFSLLAFIVGGRISFVLQNIPVFIKSPLGIISINPDVFDPYGATAVALIIAFIYGQRQNISLWNSLDALTPFFALVTIGAGLSHLAAGTAFGKETDVSWGINLWNATRHPTQIYEFLASLLTFILLWLKKHDPRPGILFLTFAALIAGSQLFIQAFRGDSTFILNGIRQGQVVAWGTLLVIFALLEQQLKKKIG